MEWVYKNGLGQPVWHPRHALHSCFQQHVQTDTQTFQLSTARHIQAMQEVYLCRMHTGAMMIWL